MFCKVDCQLELEGKRTVLRERNVTEARGGKEEREQEFLVRTFLNSLRVNCPVSSAEFPIRPPNEMHRYLGYHSLCLNIVGNFWDNVST